MQACSYQRTEGEYAIAQPAITVVPVPRAAESLGERGRGGGDDAARLVGQPLEGYEGAVHGIFEAAIVSDATGPIEPEAFRVVDRLQAVDGHRPLAVGRRPGEHERYVLSLGDRELGEDLTFHLLVGGRCAQPQRIRSRYGTHLTSSYGDPRGDVSVVKAHSQLARDRNLAPNTLDHPNQVGRHASGRHTVHRPHSAARSLPLGLQEERVPPVATPRATSDRRRCDAPAAVGVFA